MPRGRASSPRVESWGAPWRDHTRKVLGGPRQGCCWVRGGGVSSGERDTLTSPVRKQFPEGTRWSAQDLAKWVPPGRSVQNWPVVGTGGGQQSCSRPGLQANRVTALEVRAGPPDPAANLV